MNEIIQTLTNQEAGSQTATIVLLNALAYVLMALGAWLLGRRNDLGWWAYMFGVFAGPLMTALLYGYEGLISAIPAMLVGIFGLWKWSKFPTLGHFGRAVPSRNVTVKTVVTFVILVIIFTALNLGPMLTSGFAFSSGTELIVLNMVLAAIITVGFIGVANGKALSFLAIAVGALGVVVMVLANSPALGTLGSYVFVTLGAVAGWFAWKAGEPVAVEAHEAADEALEEEASTAE